MDFSEGLRTRRSVRQYIPNRDIPADDIRDILETAMLAPSGRNKQPWEFIVVNDKSKFPEITQAQPYCRFLEEASLAVIVCGNRKSAAGLPCQKTWQLLVRNLSGQRAHGKLYSFV